MDLSTWLVYAFISLVSIVSPGPASMLAISNSIAYGFKRVAFSSIGNITGLFLVSCFAMAGLGALLKTSATLFAILKVVGAGYLIYMGVRQWRSKQNIFAKKEDASPKAQLSNKQLYMQGLLLAITNPKGILFFTALFPQFIKEGRPLPLQFAILTGTSMVLSFISLTCYALLAKSTRTWFAKGRRANYFNRVSGAIFSMLGIAVLRIKN